MTNSVTNSENGSFDNNEEYDQSTGVERPSRFSLLRSSHPDRSDDENDNTLAEEVFSAKNLGLLNFFRTPSAAAVERAKNTRLISTMRLNMINTYLKFIIEAVLYCLAGLLLSAILTFALQYSIKILVPVVLLIVLQMAARNMHDIDNGFIHPGAHAYLSLGDDLVWALEKTKRTIDKTANYAVGLFQPLANKLATSNVLDRQLAYVPTPTGARY